MKTYDTVFGCELQTKWDGEKRPYVKVCNWLKSKKVSFLCVQLDNIISFFKVVCKKKKTFWLAIKFVIILSNN